jgi:hypothetical protein
LTASNAISSRKGPTAAPKGNAESSYTTKSFKLAGPSIRLDPRIDAHRGDLADVALAGRLFAAHYARPAVRSCGARESFVYGKAVVDDDPVSELLPGEEFAVLDVTGGWAWGYSVADHYVGYVEAINLAERVAATHIVAASCAPILGSPDVHAASLALLPMGSLVQGAERSGFLGTEMGFVPFTHVRPVGAFEQDPVAVAERLLGAPYRRGGRSMRGIDCSGLVQIALALCGQAAPRDSDQQRSLGSAVEAGARRQRGDLAFFEGHVGMMADEERLIHASSHAGKVAIEPLASVAERSPLLEVRRLS